MSMDAPGMGIITGKKVAVHSEVTVRIRVQLNVDVFNYSKLQTF